MDNYVDFIHVFLIFFLFQIMKQQSVQDITRQIQSAVFSSGLTTKLICLFCIIGYLLSFSPQCVRVLAVIPGRAVPPNFWIWFVQICLIYFFSN